jgi:hypothetical protein
MLRLLHTNSHDTNEGQMHNLLSFFDEELLQNKSILRMTLL